MERQSPQGVHGPEFSQDSAVKQAGQRDDLEEQPVVQGAARHACCRAGLVRQTAQRSLEICCSPDDPEWIRGTWSSKTLLQGFVRQFISHVNQGAQENHDLSDTTKVRADSAQLVDRCGSEVVLVGFLDHPSRIKVP